MTVPAWVITGLLDSGKTTLINRLIEEKLDELDILVLQFESGETPLTEHERVKKLVFSKSQLERAPLDIADAVIEYLNSHSTELILIEWNGMEHFHKLEEMFLQFMAKTVMSIKKWFMLRPIREFRRGFRMPEQPRFHRLPGVTALTSDQKGGNTAG